MSEKAARYKLVGHSVSCHCCFESTIIDTEQQDKIVCEMLEAKYADILIQVLNKQTPAMPSREEDQESLVQLLRNEGVEYPYSVADAILKLFQERGR